MNERAPRVREHAIGGVVFRSVVVLVGLTSACALDTSGRPPQSIDGALPDVDAGEATPDAGIASDADIASDAGADACTAVTCLPDAACSGVETCNAADDDCDGVIDEDAAICGEGCTAEVFEGSSYLFCADTTPWDDARAYCTHRGYDLVVVESNSENEFIRSTGIAVDNEWWIGLWSPRDDGDYEWVDGRARDFTFWEGEPTGQCVRLRTSDGAWAGKGCGGSRAFVCELAR
jgi:hypothetical protein